MILKGELLILTEGYYGSDYKIIAVCRTLADFILESEKKAYLKLYPEEEKEHGFNPYHFKRWLLDEDWIEEVEYKELTLGRNTLDKVCIEEV